MRARIALQRKVNPTDAGSPSITRQTKSLAKEFSKILIFEYFGYLKTDFDVFFDADSESPRVT